MSDNDSDDAFMGVSVSRSTDAAAGDGRGWGNRHTGASSSRGGSSSQVGSTAQARHAESTAAPRHCRDHPVSERAKQPMALRVSSLFPYQQQGVAWMVKRERGRDLPLGGLLADEQGLGKTVQVLALCLAHPQTLSASPVGAMLPGGRASLGVLVVAPLILVQQWAQEIAAKVAPPYGTNVCVHHGPKRTTSAAALAAYDFVVTTYDVLRAEHNANATSGPLFQLRWWRVVLDEAHTVRNASTGISKACCALRALHRWCLTGTPLQNRANDLFALVKFLQVPQYGASANEFSELNPRGGGSPELSALLSGLMLRRLKGDTLGGEPLLQLPEKQVTVLQGTLSTEERRIYDQLAAQAQRVFFRLLRHGGVNGNYLHILALLTRLRQACDSPRLVTKALDDLNAAAEEAATAASGEPTPAALKKAESMVAAGGSGVEDCPICMDTVTLDGGVVTGCGHPYCRECISDVILRSEQLGDPARCPICRGGLNTSDLYSLRRMIPSASDTDDAAIAVVDGAMGGSADGPAAAPDAPSTKTRLVVQTVRQMLETDATAKCLVFSSYTKYLNILGGALDAEGLNYARIDGTMNLRTRDQQISNFRNGRRIPIMLMSLKCGVGLNLTCASTVILVEPWWNPFVEEQAIDRVHRIGQTKPVTVVRVAVPDTVEDRILSLQKQKRVVADGALGDNGRTSGEGNAAANRLSERDFMNLFGAPRQ